MMGPCRHRHQRQSAIVTVYNTRVRTVREMLSRRTPRAPVTAAAAPSWWEHPRTWRRRMRDAFDRLQRMECGADATLFQHALWRVARNINFNLRAVDTLQVPSGLKCHLRRVCTSAHQHCCLMPSVLSTFTVASSGQGTPGILRTCAGR